MQNYCYYKWFIISLKFQLDFAKNINILVYIANKYAAFPKNINSKKKIVKRKLMPIQIRNIVIILYILGIFLSNECFKKCFNIWTDIENIVINIMYQ